ncbi:MAG: tail fiber domain-containing protein [Deltaproteobacteria bacterium]|nr:tail fiber domain-containing protein [Deltaproteobacteria bacterium]
MKVLFILFTFFLAPASFANNPGVSYQGRIFKPDGNPLEGSSVQFRLQVRSPGSENCLLYEEVQTLNMAGSSGVFALTLNDGTGTRLDTATYQVDRIFANRETMTLDTTRCATGTTYTPNSSDGRKLVVYFKDETMAAYEAMPLMNLNYVPQAMYALEAQKVDKFEVSHILRAVDGSGNPATAPALNPTQLTNLNTLLATPAANYVQTTSNGSVALPVVAGNPSSGLATGQIWYDSGSNVMKYYDGAVKTFGTSSGLSSVGLTLPGMFSVTNSPLTANGSITATLANQTANTVFAGPASGGPAAPTFRALASTDLPITGAAGTFINGGNSFGVAGNIGTNDAFDLNLKTNNTTKMTILSNGNVGVGTTAPQEKLNVVGNVLVNGNNLFEFFGNSFPQSSGKLQFQNFYDSDPGVGMTTGNSKMSIQDITINANGDSRLSVLNNSDVEIFSVTSAGNVGIGTTTPVSRLTVNETNVATSGTRNLSDFSLIVLPPSASTAVNQGFQLKAYNNSTGAYGYGAIRGMRIESTFNGAATSSASTVEGINVVSSALGGTATNVTGANILAMGSGSPTTTLTRLTGIDLTTELDGPASTVNMYGVSSNLSTSGTVTSTNRYGFYHNDYNSGTSTNSYGVYIYDDNWGTVTNHYGIFLDTRATATNNWGVYQKVSAAKNYFAGNVGIGTTAPQTTLQVAGVISPAVDNTTTLGSATYRFTTVYATNGTINTSDRREKKDIYETDLGLDFINKLRPVSYRWNSGIDNDVHYGLIAQEAEQVIDEIGKGEKTSIVTHDETTDRYGVRYSELISPLIKAIQELYMKFLGVDHKIAFLKVENASIKQENAELKARLDQQEKELAAIKNKLGL